MKRETIRTFLAQCLDHQEWWVKVNMTTIPMMMMMMMMVGEEKRGGSR